MTTRKSLKDGFALFGTTLSVPLAAAAASGTLKVVPNSAKPSFKDFRVVIIASRTER